MVIRPSDSSSNTFLNSFAASPRMESSTVLKPTLHSYDSSLESSPVASSLFEQADITNRMNRMKRKKLFNRKILTRYPLLIGVLYVFPCTISFLFYMNLSVCNLVHRMQKKYSI